MDITNKELADMLDDQTIIGKTVEFSYRSGPNRSAPVYMTFTGYNETNDRIEYLLTNPNTEKKFKNFPYSFCASEFIFSLLNPDHTHESIRIVNQEPVWAL